MYMLLSMRTNRHIHIPIAGDVGRLLGGQVEVVGALLDALRIHRQQCAGLQQFAHVIEKSQFL